MFLCQLNIYPAEIEIFLMSHPLIKEAQLGLGVANSTCSYFMIVIVKCKTMFSVTNSTCIIS